MQKRPLATNNVPLETRIYQAGAVLAAATRVVCLTGAGVSAESGIATFRDAKSGFWAKFNPEQLASQAGFAADGGLVWRWYMERLRAVEQAQPNLGHLALAQLARRIADFTLVTQNVDDLHERAGHDHVLHLHGHLHRFRCNLCNDEHRLEMHERNQSEPPRCARCGDRVRPDVVWFGEMMPSRIWDAAWRATQRCQVMLVVGTSAVVYPASQLPLAAAQQGATVIDINPECTPISEMAAFFLQGASGQILPRLMAAVDQATGIA